MGEEVTEFRGILEGSAISIDFFQGRVDDLGESIQRQQGIISTATQRQTELAAAGQSSSEEYRTLNGEIIEANNVITALRSEHSRYNAIVSLGEENLRASSISTDLFTESTADAEQAVKDASEAVRDGAIAHAQYTASAAMVRENLEALAESQEVLNTFWQVASGQVEDYGASIETIIPTVTDLTAAENALTAAIDANLTLQDEFVGDAQALIAIYENVRGGLSDLDITQRLANEEIKLVNPAVSDAVRSMRAYIDELEDVEGGLVDVEMISENVRRALGSQGDAFDDLRDDVDTAEVSLDDIDDTMDDIGRTIEDDLIDSVTSLDLAFEELGNNIPGFLADTLAILGEVNEEIAGVADSVNNLVGAAASGNPIAFLAEIPGLARELNALQTDESLTTSARADRVFGVISQIEDSDLSPQQQQQLIAPLQDYIRELLTRSILSATEAFAPALIAQHQAFAGTRGLDFDFDTSRENLGLGDTGFQTAFDLDELDLTPVIAQLEAVAEISEILNQDITPALQPNFQAQSRGAFAANQARQDAPGASELSQQYAAAVAESENAAEAVEELAALADFFSFDRGERDVLSPLEASVNTAQDALDALGDDASAEDRIAAYQALAAAEQALYDQQVSFITNATEITDEARGRALEVAGSVFDREIREANDDLVDSLEEIGAELVNVLAFTSGILTGSALAVRQIPLDLAPITDADFTPQDPVTPIERQTGGIEESVVPGTEPNSTALLRNAANRSRFELGRATGEEDFETRRGTLITDINAFYDAELARIAEVEGSEEELQNLREDNQLARDRALDSATNRNNTFAEARIAEEERVAEAAVKGAEDAAEAKIKADEAATEAAIKLAEDESEANQKAYDEAIEAQIQADAEAERTRVTAIGATATAARNTLNRSRFELGRATGEEDFESRRGTLITDINAFYDAELLRIAEVEGSELELQNLRNANQLSRDQALNRATNRSNTFAEARIKEEEQVAEAAIKAAEDATEAKIKADEAVRDAAIKLADEVSEANQKAYDEAIAAQVAAEAEAERTRIAAIGAAATAARNTLNRSQFELGRSGSEEDFESNRQAVITDINAFYDTELEQGSRRLKGLNSNCRTYGTQTNFHGIAH